MNYQLKEILVPPSDLLLDPNNPRLQTVAGVARVYKEEDVASPSLQQRLFLAMTASEHEVRELAESIKHHGFVSVDSIVVYRLRRVEKFLVIEGNRRTTAIKLLLKDESALADDVKRSLRRVPVKEIITQHDHVLEDVTDLILSIRHVYGVKQWQPMQRAHTIHGAFIRQRRNDLLSLDFRYDARVAADVATVMNIPTKSVRSELMIYRVFLQLQNLGYPVRSDHYSLIDLAVSNRGLQKTFFELDPLLFQFSADGADRFYKLCIQESAPIHNPADFRSFVQVFRNGTDRDVSNVVECDEPLDVVFERVTHRQQRRAAAHSLEQAQNIIEQIELSLIRGTQAELNAVSRIEKLIDAIRRTHVIRNEG